VHVPFHDLAARQGDVNDAIQFIYETASLLSNIFDVNFVESVMLGTTEHRLTS